MARLAHQFAILDAHITADVIDLTLFPEMARRYQIYATPALVINDREPIFGFLREEELAQQVLRIAGPRPFEEE
ncbi:MAG TPA: thioredoxin family protein [Ktedonobacterales bacterium]